MLAFAWAVMGCPYNLNLILHSCYRHVEMIEWPKHNEAIREDELFLFAYCIYRWADDSYISRSPQQYTDVVARLNDRFQSRFGEYSNHAVRRYIQLLRSNPNYRWPATSQKRFHYFATEIEQYRIAHRTEFGPGAPSHRAIDIVHKRMCSVWRVGVLQTGILNVGLTVLACCRETEHSRHDRALKIIGRRRTGHDTRRIRRCVRSATVTYLACTTTEIRSRTDESIVNGSSGDIW